MRSVRVLAALAVPILAGACANDDRSAFDPDNDSIPPELVSLEVSTENGEAYAVWQASEPVRAVFEFGDAPDALYRHAYSCSKAFETSGVIELVGVPSGATFYGVLRMTDRAGNEASRAPGGSPTFSTGAVAAEDLLFFAMIDVGWGDALFLRAPDGTTTLVDAGHPQDGPAVRRFLDSQGVTRLDFASLSHVHEDHVGGFYGDEFNLVDGVFRTFTPGVEPIPCDTFLDIADKTSGNGPYDELVESLEGIPGFEETTQLRWGASSESEPALQWGEGVRVDLLSAGKKDYLIPEYILEAENGSVLNNDSMVYRVQFGRFVMILTGDGEFTTEQFLEDHWPVEILGACVLKIGHHGSSDASSERFLRIVDPLVGFIPNALSENPGVETPVTLGRIRNLGADYFASDRVIPNRDRTLPGVRGDVLLWTDGEAFTIVAEPVEFE